MAHNSGASNLACKSCRCLKFVMWAVEIFAVSGAGITLLMSVTSFTTRSSTSEPLIHSSIQLVCNNSKRESSTKLLWASYEPLTPKKYVLLGQNGIFTDTVYNLENTFIRVYFTVKLTLYSILTMLRIFTCSQICKWYVCDNSCNSRNGAFLWLYLVRLH